MDNVSRKKCSVCGVEMTDTELHHAESALDTYCIPATEWDKITWQCEPCYKPMGDTYKLRGKKKKKKKKRA